MDTSTKSVIHNPDASRFELTIDGHTAVLDYRLTSDTITFMHTGVPSAIENRGIGSKLVKAGLEYARARQLKVKTFCWFVSKYIRHHPEYQDME